MLAALVRDKGFQNVLFGASVLASDVAGGLSARLDAGLNWDMNDLEMRDGALVGKRSALGDTVRADVGWSAEPRLGLVRAGSFEATSNGGDPAVEDVPVSLEDFSTKAELVEHTQEESTGPSIEDADILVTGGRGLGGPEGFGRSRSSPPRSAGRSPPRAPWWTRAGTPIRPRSARPARSCRRRSTSGSACPARSSTRWACRPRR